MANINEILARAAALRDETALNSISPERAGGIMYDTLMALNELWLQQGAALVISKIYASVDAMEADTEPVSDISGKPLRPGQIVVIASEDEDNGSVYRYNGTDSPSWSLVGNIGNLEPVDSLDSDSTQLPLAAHQGKVLDEKISQLGQNLIESIGGDLIYPCYVKSDGETEQYNYSIKSGVDVGLYIDADSVITGTSVLRMYIYTTDSYKSKVLTNKQSYASLRTVFDDYSGDILGFKLYITNVSGAGEVSTKFSYGGLNKEVADVKTFAERKIEKLAWVSASSGGKTDWVVGDKIFNTTRNKLAVCTSPSPSVDFGPDYDASQESLYIYDGYVYRYDGTNMIKTTVKESELENVFVILRDGVMSKSYNVVTGSDIDGTYLNSPYVYPLQLNQGDKFSVKLTSTVVTGMSVYGISAGGTIQRLTPGLSSGAEVNYIAPFNMVALGIYISSSSITGNGQYTLTVKTVSIRSVYNDVQSLQGHGELTYFGQKVPSLNPLNNKFSCAEEILVSENKGTSVNDITSGMAVCKGRAFCFGDNDNGVSKCSVFNLSDMTQVLVTLPWAAHNNNAQPTPYYYDANDTYPLLLVSRGDYPSSGISGQKFYFVRVTESGGTYQFTIVKTVSFQGFAGAEYNCSWFANYEKNELYCYTFPNGGWSVVENNPIIIYEFDFPSMDNYDEVTLTDEDIRGTVQLQDHWIMQSGLYHDGKFFIQVEGESNWDLTINGEPYDQSKGRHFLFIINRIGYIETIVPLHSYQEQEGMCIYNGALYMSEKLTNAQAGNVCFQLVKYTFD